MDNSTTDSMVHTVSPESNYAFASIYIACMIVGLPGNIVSLRYVSHGCITIYTTIPDKRGFKRVPSSNLD